MMKKNLWLLGGLVAIAFSACTNEDVLPNDNTLASGKKVQVTAYAPGDEVESRVAFSENGGAISLAWENEESFSVIRGTENQTFSKNSEGNTFEGVLPTQGTDTYYAVYPANADADNHEQVPYDLSVQTGAMNSNTTYMYASSANGEEFQFRHTTAVLKATFSNSDWTADTKIKEVKVILPESNAEGTINLADHGALTGTGNNLITISNAEPVAATAAVYIYLPPMEKDNKTLVFVVTTSDGKTYTAIFDGKPRKAIEAGNVYTAEVTLSPMNYLMFVAEKDGQRLIMSSHLEFSTDGTSWDNLGTTEPYFQNKLLFLRGRENYTGTDGETISFGNPDIKVACLGDIRTLVHYENYATMTDASNIVLTYTEDTETYTEIYTANFQNLFKNCTVLTSAPALPFTTLSENCYSEMFSGCSNLNSVTMLAEDINASNCLYNWLEGVASSGTITKASSTTLPEGASGIPAGWTVNNK